MLNKVILIGRLASSPDLRYTTSGHAVARFPLAVERSYANKKDGKKEVDFFTIITWNKLAENCSNHLGKGRLVCVTGQLQTRTYDDSNGIRRKVVEVVADNVRFLDWPKEGKGKPEGNFEQDFGQDEQYTQDDIDVPF